MKSDNLSSSMFNGLEEKSLNNIKRYYKLDKKDVLFISYGSDDTVYKSLGQLSKY